MDVKDPKHCYANPFKPGLCLFVALGIYLACNSDISDANLFPGSKQKVLSSSFDFYIDTILNLFRSGLASHCRDS